MENLYDIEGLDKITPSTSVTIRHDYATKEGWPQVEDDQGNKFALSYVEVNDSGEVTAHAFELTKDGRKKGSYPSYLRQVRDIAGYTDLAGNVVERRVEIIQYKVTGFIER